jgi:hypothetical protein
MTLARIDGDATVEMPGLVPIPILTEDMDSGWIGQTSEASGYGQQENGGYGEREFTAEPIVQLSGDTVTIDGQGERGVCFGDSGGPLMAIASDGTVRVIGALSNGDNSCVGRDNYTRVDTYRDWIESYTGPTVVDGADCGAIDPVGRCNGDMAMWCGASGTLETSMCADGTSCGWDTATSGFRCITGPDPCGGFDAFGGCEGETARWCDNGVQRERDCGGCDQVCDTSMGAGGAYCFDDPCMGLDYHGQCNGDVAEWCDDGEFRSEDCAANGQTCAYINDNIGYYCQ